MDIEVAKKRLEFLKWQINRPPKYTTDNTSNYEDARAIEAVLNELENANTVIDLLADDLRYYEGMQQDQLFCIDTCEGKMCDKEHCKERIKEYFYKKVRNNGIKRK